MTCKTLLTVVGFIKKVKTEVQFRPESVGYYQQTKNLQKKKKNAYYGYALFV